MFKLRIVQAEYGDCFILEYGTYQHPRYALIDGGPNTVYQNHLRSELQSITSTGGHLDFMALSHIDDDHVNGLLDLASELYKQKEKCKPPTITIEALLHNTFSQTLGVDIEDNYKAWIGQNPRQAKSIFVDQSERSILQGDKLTNYANLLEIPINPGIEPSQPIRVNNPKSALTFGNLTLQVIGPNQRNLERLRKDWLKWLEQQSTRDIRAPSDQTVPNLSSLIFLAKADEKTILLTGDGRSDDLLEGLSQAGVTDSQSPLHVDILKLPHHGSARSISKDFFKIVTADRYVISANGKDDNPDLDTLKWIVEADREPSRKIEIIVTNQTKSTQDLLIQCSTDKYNYTLEEMAKVENSRLVFLDED
jgi:beta-lactamase superfamily II metal-dependent hydrolase